MDIVLKDGLTYTVHDKCLLERAGEDVVRAIFLDKEGGQYYVADIVEYNASHFPKFRSPAHRIFGCHEFQCSWPVDLGKARTLDTKIKKSIEQMNQ